MMAYAKSMLVRLVIPSGIRSPRHGGHRSGAGLDLRDYAGGHGHPDDVVAAVVLAGDAVEGLDVDSVGSADGRFQFAPQATQMAIVLTSG